MWLQNPCYLYICTYVHTTYIQYWPDNYCLFPEHELRCATFISLMDYAKVKKTECPNTSTSGSFMFDSIQSRSHLEGRVKAQFAIGSGDDVQLASINSPTLLGFKVCLTQCVWRGESCYSNSVRKGGDIGMEVDCRIERIKIRSILVERDRLWNNKHKPSIFPETKAFSSLFFFSFSLSV